MNKQLMVSRINAAKEKLNLGDSELSIKLGHHRNYISRVLHQENPTVEQMTKVVDKVNALIDEQKLPCGNPLPEFKHMPIADAVMVAKDEYSEMYSKNTALCVEVGHLKKEVEYKNQVLDKRNAVLENHINRVNELELQLKTTQQKFVDVVDQKDSEIKKLKNDCNHATNQYQGKRAQVVRLNERVKKQAAIYMIIIAILFIASIVGFVS